MVHEQPHSDGPHDEQWHQPPVPLQGPDPHQDVSIPPLEVAVLGVGPISQEELCTEPSLQAVPTAGRCPSASPRAVAVMNGVPWECCYCLTSTLLPWIVLHPDSGSRSPCPKQQSTKTTPGGNEAGANWSQP